VLTLDIRRAAWQAAQDAVAAGELPTLPEGPADPSSVRQVPAGLGAAPGRYASTLPYLLAKGGVTPHRAAAVLARRLAATPWIAEVTAPAGHLNLTVTAGALARLAVRIPAAPGCARSDLLRGLRFPAPPPADLASAAGWEAARSWLVAEAVGRLAAAAGAEIFDERARPTPSPGPPSPPFDTALAYAGPDVIRYALLTNVPGGPWPASPRLSVRQDLGNPAYAVRYAHAHAASTLRQAADLGLGRGDADEFESRLLGRPQQRALLDGLSWLPERVAGAARRRRPGELARYLEELAYTYRECWESCPALPFGGHRAPRDPGTTRARLWLVTAVRTTFAAGLALLGISAPGRL
jgi:arginyl-tRNA synthetase